MKSHPVTYDDRALQVVFPEGPEDAATHAHDAIEAVHGLSIAIGRLHHEHAQGRSDFTEELGLALRGLQMLASLAVALDLQRAVAEVSA